MELLSAVPGPVAGQKSDCVSSFIRNHLDRILRRTTYGIYDTREPGATCGMCPAQWCQAYFVLATGGILATAALPQAIRRFLVEYGARVSSRDERPGEVRKPEDGMLLSLIRELTSRGQISHSWFISFYLTSTACCIFWAIQYVTDGRVLRIIASRQAEVAAPSVNLEQVMIAWALMTLQGSRRLYEHLVIVQPSQSKIWIVHWLFGMSFYLCMGVAIWVEGSSTNWRPGRCRGGTVANEKTGAILNERLSLDRLRTVPIKVVAALPLFVFAWLAQFQCHKYLSGLKKYSLPTRGMFRHLVCPHYTCECLIYLSLAMAAAPEGHLCNRTILCGLMLVAVNLGVTAAGTRRWYVGKFGLESVAGRRTMIPFIF